MFLHLYRSWQAFGKHAFQLLRQQWMKKLIEEYCIFSGTGYTGSLWSSLLDGFHLQSYCEYADNEWKRGCCRRCTTSRWWWRLSTDWQELLYNNITRNITGCFISLQNYIPKITSYMICWMVKNELITVTFGNQKIESFRPENVKCRYCTLK